MAQKYYVERILQSVVTVVGVLTLAFVLIRFMPGGPMDFLRAQFARDPTQDIQAIESLVEAYINVNPSRPLWEQYLSYVGSVLQGDFGRSLWFDKPVITILANALPWTLFLATMSITLSFIMGVVFGAFMAYYEGSAFDKTMTVVTLFTTSTPYYIVALVLLYFVAYQNSWFPTGGKYAAGVTPGLNVTFVISSLYYATLPILSGVIAGFGGGSLGMRGNSIRVLGDDYLRVARLRGLPERRIILRYVGRNAILPMWTGLMIRIGGMLGGAIILETIFTYQGIGYYLFRALETRDTTLLMGGFVMITISVVIGILIADLTYGLIDPRAQTGGDREAY